MFVVWIKTPVSSFKTSCLVTGARPGVTRRLKAANVACMLAAAQRAATALCERLPARGPCLLLTVESSKPDGMGWAVDGPELSWTRAAIVWCARLPYRGRTALASYRYLHIILGVFCLYFLLYKANHYFVATNLLNVHKPSILKVGR